jgi:hypothetical protein
MHADEKELARKTGNTVQYAKENGFVADADIAASATVAALKTAIETRMNGNSMHGEVSAQTDGIKRALDTAQRLGIISDATVAADATVAQFLARWTTAGVTLNPSSRDTFLPGI